MTYVFTNDYKNEFRRYIDALFNDKASTREDRINAIQTLTDAYIEHTGERPDTIQLDRLATLILREELTDTDRMKSRNNDYPIMSDDQLGRREKEQVSFTLAEEVATDGRDYRPCNRDNNRKMRELTRQI